MCRVSCVGIQIQVRHKHKHKMNIDVLPTYVPPYQPYHTRELEILETTFATRASVQNVLYLGGASRHRQPSLHNSLLEQVWGHHNIYLNIGIAQTA